MLKIVSAATNQNFNQAILLLFFFGKMSKGGATLCIGIVSWIKMLKIVSTALNQNSTKQKFFGKMSKGAIFLRVAAEGSYNVGAIFLGKEAKET